MIATSFEAIEDGKADYSIRCVCQAVAIKIHQTITFASQTGLFDVLSIALEELSRRQPSLVSVPHRVERRIMHRKDKAARVINVITIMYI